MRILLLLFFFLSGACGLIYEVVWTKLLTLLIGSTTFSITTVLVAFMGGLALGSYLGGRLIDRKGDPLVTYGILEGLIGLYCLAIPFLIRSTEPLFGFFYNKYYTDQIYLFSLARFLISALILIVPTTMMGATLPILSKFFVSNRKRFGWNVGRLYAINTFGAVVGSFSCGFILLPMLGKWMTIVTAALANLFICALVLIYRFLIKKRAPVDQIEAEASVSDGVLPENTAASGTGLTIRPMVVWAVLLAYAANGFAGMAYQIVWTRALSLSFGGSAYVFSQILTVFILGLAFGSGVGARLVDRLKNPVAVFGWVEILIGFTSVLTMIALGQLPLWMIRVVYRYQSSYNTLLAVQFGIVFALTFLPAFLMGAAFPLAVKIISLARAGVGKPVGLAYAWNTVGAILGSFVGGFILVPLIGLQRTISFGNGINWLAGAVLLGLGITLVKSKSGLWRWPVAFAPACFGILLMIIVPKWDPQLLLSGPFIYADQYIKRQNEIKTSLRSILESYNMVFYKEGVDANVRVIEYGNPPILSLAINGKSDASTGGDMPTQELIGHVPMLLHEGTNPRVLVIGLASGITVGSVTRHPGAKVDVVEISRAVVDACSTFNNWNYNILSNPNVNLIIADAINHLKLTNKKYDVIISEPTNPWIAGVSGLFTKEYFEAAKSRLNTGGVFCAWLQAYELRPEEFRMVMRTFLEVFPQASMWEAQPGGDYLLMATDGPFRPNFAEIERRMAIPDVENDLKRVSINNAPRLISLLFMGPDLMSEIAGEGEIHTEDRLQLEYITPKYLYLNDFPGFYKTIFRFAENPLDIYPELADTMSDETKDKLAKYVEARGLALQALVRRFDGRLGDAKIIYEQYLEIVPDDQFTRKDFFDFLNEKGLLAFRSGNYEKAIELYTEAVGLNPENYLVEDRMGSAYLALSKRDEAKEAFSRALKKNPKDPIAMFNLGYLAMGSQDYGDAENWFRQALGIWPDYPDALNGMGAVAAQFQRLDQATEYFERAVKLNPNFADAHKNLGFALARNKARENRRKEGIAHLKKAMELDPNIPDRGLMEQIINESQGK